MGKCPNPARQVDDQSGLAAAIVRHLAGAKLRLILRRDGRELEVVAELRTDKDRRGTSSRQELMRLWGPLSDVRLGFEEVIQHDSVIRPSQCGGPLVNLEGEVVGINIARVGRFESLAVTSKVVAKALEGILARRR